MQNHFFVVCLLVVLATFRVSDYHGCNGQVSSPSNTPPLPFPPPPPAVVQFPPPPPFQTPPRAPLTRPSDPNNCCFDPYHCCDHDDDSKSRIDILLVVLVAAILFVLIVAYIFFLFNFWGVRRFVGGIGTGLQSLVQAINENLVKATNGVTGAINTNLGANGPINKSLTSIDGKLGEIDGKLGALPGPLNEISKRLENICPMCMVYVTGVPCKCGGSTCQCGHPTSSACECGGSSCSPCRCDG